MNNSITYWPKIKKTTLLPSDVCRTLGKASIQSASLQITRSLECNNGDTGSHSKSSLEKDQSFKFSHNMHLKFIWWKTLCYVLNGILIFLPYLCTLYYYIHYIQLKTLLFTYSYIAEQISFQSWMNDHHKLKVKLLINEGISVWLWPNHHIDTWRHSPKDPQVILFFWLW